MFTGIIEEVGSLRQVNQGNEHYQLTISASKILGDVNIGDSIAVNGICLTVTTFTSSQFQVDVMPETLKATGLEHVAIGSKVNLERAMSANGRFGGHFMSGHVDGMGKIKNIIPRHNAVYYEIEISPELIKYLAPKGSVGIDGVSLTVVDVKATQFSVSLIPHTVQETIFQYKHSGDIVNIECDMLAKYVDRLLQQRSDSHQAHGVTLDKLEDNGYV